MCPGERWHGRAHGPQPTARLHRHLRAAAGGPAQMNVCGLCGMLSDSSYVTGGFLHDSVEVV